jgi:CubicO group peptidase (beta-lactamase class C family)
MPELSQEEPILSVFKTWYHQAKKSRRENFSSRGRLQILSSKLSAIILSIGSLLIAGSAYGEDAPFLDFGASDPIVLGWMVGSPPPADKVIRFEDGSFRRFPQSRWSFSHWRELVPTVNVSRGSGRISALPNEERKDDLDAVTFVPLGGSQSMTWAESLSANYTDGIVVLHKGRIVYERYFGALTPERPHIAFSATKSLFGTIAGMLIAEGKLDPRATVGHYIPELRSTGFSDATVAEVLDMTTALKYSEDYDDPNADVAKWRLAYGGMPRPNGYSGPRSEYEYLATIPKDGEHGVMFHYRSINTTVVGWLISRVTGMPVQRVLEALIWAPLGAEGDAYMQVDSTGTPVAAGGFNARLRDMARFGEMIRLGGRYNGQQIVPAEVVAEIRRGGSRDAFAAAGYKTLPGWSYHNHWWVSHNDHGAFMARGLHGQAIYIDPKAEMVIARFASHPKSGNVNIDPTSLPAYEAIASHLMARNK